MSEGEFWMKWDKPERTGFVRGFLIGYQTAYRDACTTVRSQSETQTTTKKPSNDEFECESHRAQFQKEVAQYEETMTNFYTTYPEDHDLPLHRLMKLLADPEPKTPQQIHEWLNTLNH